MAYGKNSVFSPGPKPKLPPGQSSGPGLGDSFNSDVLEPQLYSGHQQPGPADQGTPAKSHNTVFAVGRQAQPMGGIAAGQSGLARRFAGKLGAGGYGKPKVQPGHPAGAFRGK